MTFDAGAYFYAAFVIFGFIGIIQLAVLPFIYWLLSGVSISNKVINFSIWSMLTVISTFVFFMTVVMRVEFSDVLADTQLQTKIALTTLFAATMTWWLKLSFDYQHRVFDFSYREIHNYKRAIIEMWDEIADDRDKLGLKRTIDADTAYNIIFHPQTEQKDGETTDMFERRLDYYRKHGNLLVNVSNYSWMFVYNKIDSKLGREFTAPLIESYCSVAYYLIIAELLTDTFHRAEMITSTNGKWGRYNFAPERKFARRFRRELLRGKRDETEVPEIIEEIAGAARRVREEPNVVMRMINRVMSRAPDNRSPSARPILPVTAGALGSL